MNHEKYIDFENIYLKFEYNFFLLIYYNTYIEDMKYLKLNPRIYK